MMRGFRGALLTAALLAVSAGVAHAQAIGTIFGKVTDPSGATLPGVTVTVTGPTLQAPLVTTTQDSGAYQFPSVPIGTYTVTFKVCPYSNATRGNIDVTLTANGHPVPH